MDILIPRTIEKKLPIRVRVKLSSLDKDQKLMFIDEYEKKNRSLFFMMALSFFFPIQLFLLGRTALGVIFFLTLGGGLVWYIIEWFITPTRTSTYNDEIADRILYEIALLR